MWRSRLGSRCGHARLTVDNFRHGDDAVIDFHQNFEPGPEIPEASLHPSSLVLLKTTCQVSESLLTNNYSAAPFRRATVVWLASNAVSAMVYTISSTDAPRDRSFTGFRNPCSIGPIRLNKGVA